MKLFSSALLLLAATGSSAVESININPQDPG
jgi:hypothetical protein